MIQFFYENLAESVNTDYTKWLEEIILSEEKKLGDINYIFCDDDYLLQLNEQYLDHDTLTDIISFDYSVGNELHGDIYISIERVFDNALDFAVSTDEELRRVMAHGILHYCGFKDKEETDTALMRQKEDEKIAMFHVEP